MCTLMAKLKLHVRVCVCVCEETRGNLGLLRGHLLFISTRMLPTMVFFTCGAPTYLMHS